MQVATRLKTVITTKIKQFNSNRISKLPYINNKHRLFSSSLFLNTIQVLTKFGDYNMAYITRSSVAPRAGLIVLHDVFGINQNFMDFCDTLAERTHSHLIAPDFFNGNHFQDLTEARKNVATYNEDVTWSHTYSLIEKAATMLTEVKQTTRVGLLGLGFGSMLAFETICKNADLSDATCLFYNLPSEKIMVENAKNSNEWAPVISHLCANNENKKESMKKSKLLSKLTKDIGNCHHYLYENTHGPLFMDLSCIDDYSERAANLALDRTVEFFREEVNDKY